MSAFGGKADIASDLDVRAFDPKPDMSRSGLLHCKLTLNHSAARKSLP
jgi:hypothetical protein